MPNNIQFEPLIFHNSLLIATLLRIDDAFLPWKKRETSFFHFLRRIDEASELFPQWASARHSIVTASVALVLMVQIFHYLCCRRRFISVYGISGHKWFLVYFIMTFLKIVSIYIVMGVCDGSPVVSRRVPGDSVSELIGECKNVHVLDQPQHKITRKLRRCNFITHECTRNLNQYRSP